MGKVVQVIEDRIYINGERVNHLSALIDKASGIFKYGEKEYVQDYFDKLTTLYRGAGFVDIAENFKLIDFEGSTLNNEEIATFLNYMIEVSANSENINKMLDMDEEELKGKLKMLGSLGF